LSRRLMLRLRYREVNGVSLSYRKPQPSVLLSDLHWLAEEVSRWRKPQLTTSGGHDTDLQ
jgi:hypothetical protein